MRKQFKYYRYSIWKQKAWNGVDAIKIIYKMIRKKIEREII